MSARSAPDIPDETSTVAKKKDGPGRPPADIPTTSISARVPVALVPAIEALAAVRSSHPSAEVKRAAEQHVITAYKTLTSENGHRNLMSDAEIAQVADFLKAAEAYFKTVGIEIPKGKK